MKRIINGKRYDTETAEQVHAWDNGRDSSDFHCREKVLYRTAKGAWFLHHSGGALTDMARPCGSNGTCGSASLEPISAADALAFLTSHGGTAEAEEYFPDAIEDA